MTKKQQLVKILRGSLDDLEILTVKDLIIMRAKNMSKLRYMIALNPRVFASLKIKYNTKSIEIKIGD